MEPRGDYSTYKEFVEEHLEDNFTRVEKNGDNHDVITAKALAQQRQNKQYLFVSDLISFNHLYKSEVITDVLGYDRDSIGPGTILEFVHPEDLDRYLVARSKLFNLAQDLYLNRGGESLISCNFRFKGKSGSYINVLFQCYVFWTKVPVNTALQMMVVTDVTKFVNSAKQLHHYCGSDISHFRYPDNQLLSIGVNLSKRETQIVKLISEGLTSEEIAVSLFLSVKTVNTHRSNILKKTEKSNILEVIHELRRIGML